MVYCSINHPCADHPPLERKAWDDLLKTVARTFALSLLHLPKAIRQPMALAYLLARLSDTVVDTQSVPVALRKETLSCFNDCIQHSENATHIDAIRSLIHACLPYFSGADRVLLEHGPDLFSLLAQQSFVIQNLIQEVLLQIFAGQSFDLNYFDQDSALVYLKTEQELDQYLYWVAGAVGVFWTRLCDQCIPNFTSQPMAQLLPQAIAFGKALQLTNILRDVHDDLKQGRCYLPLSTGLSLVSTANRDDLMTTLVDQYPTLIPKWRAQTFLYLEEAKKYTRSMTNRRIRFSVFVPYDLAHKTLAALPVKISRQAVYGTLFHAWVQSYLWAPGRALL